MATSYYTFELDDGARTGLVRELLDDAGYTLERVDRAGDWVDDPELMRYFVDPGDSNLVAISRNQARKLAKRYGVELAAP